MAPLPATLKRIHREIADVHKEDLGAITLTPSDDLFAWHGSLPGPEGSVYEGGTFNFAVELPKDYPFSAPKVVLKTRIYHMNISDQGNICLDILKHNWSPALSLFKVILSLSSLLTDPNPKDPLGMAYSFLTDFPLNAPVPAIATQFQRNRKLHDSTARQWTDLYARPKVSAPSPVVAPPRASAPIRQSRITPTNAAASSSQTSPIIIDDSDEETSRSAGKKRKRDKGSTLDVEEEQRTGIRSKKRPERSGSRRPTEVIDID
ncbi:UBIQUITIN-CONJUGAT-2 domain-containing protein [Mycena indigotica]|uniref:UBIQUITIN-CONJUGAT-2 domain-containing protein n=1 Tax=Mycena indigotica TaxID=2126181 RepID=A0A8H6SQM1_9AGAR|nr:UBIQUITIN-CONJUGAT-2 domain-containing protein [Mycena indigotica]KAF7303711.1 UBIQUITIN-CONJUGAT-2 domain-containing protein [Mycena indigotica]